GLEAASDELLRDLASRGFLPELNVQPRHRAQTRKQCLRLSHLARAGQRPVQVVESAAHVVTREPNQGSIPQDQELAGRRCAAGLRLPLRGQLERVVPLTGPDHVPRERGPFVSRKDERTQLLSDWEGLYEKLASTAEVAEQGLRRREVVECTRRPWRPSGEGDLGRLLELCESLLVSLVGSACADVVERVGSKLVEPEALGHCQCLL